MAWAAHFSGYVAFMIFMIAEQRFNKTDTFFVALNTGAILFHSFIALTNLLNYLGQEGTQCL